MDSAINSHKPKQGEEMNKKKRIAIEKHRKKDKKMKARIKRQKSQRNLAVHSEA
jgi:hypothetical protein